MTRSGEGIDHAIDGKKRKKTDSSAIGCQKERQTCGFKFFLPVSSYQVIEPIK
jgi:hypothetical protein